MSLSLLGGSSNDTPSQQRTEIMQTEDEEGEWAYREAVDDITAAHIVTQWCNPPEEINGGEEGGGLDSPYQLLGVVVNIRHGDRGPLRGIRNLEELDCNHHTMISEYDEFYSTIERQMNSKHYGRFAGFFKKFDLLPPRNTCLKNDLTPKGVKQLIKVGQVLKEVYIDQMNLVKYPWNRTDIVAYSTNFNRNFQSAVAFLYGFLPQFDVSLLQITRGYGYWFCFPTCKCRHIRGIDHRIFREKNEWRNSHSKIVNILSRMSGVVSCDFGGCPYITNNTGIRDSLLAHACHNHSLPCANGVCATSTDLYNLITFEDWVAGQRTKARLLGSQMKAYMLLNKTLKAMHTMIIHEKPKIQLYSCHDTTLNYLLDTFGITDFDYPYYSSRLIFETYKNNQMIRNSSSGDYGYFLRIVYNGRDLTRHVSFCRNKLKVVKNGEGNSVDLCPVSEFTKFMATENYFVNFELKSYKEICVTTPKRHGWT